MDSEFGYISENRSATYRTMKGKEIDEKTLKSTTVSKKD